MNNGDETMNYSELRQKWFAMQPSGRLLGILVFLLILIIGGQGYYIHQLSGGKKTSMDHIVSSTRSNSSFQDLFSIPDSLGLGGWGDPSQDPFAHMQKMHENMNHLFSDDFFGGNGLFPGHMNGFKLNAVPELEVRNEKDQIVVSGKIPGIEQANLNVSVQGRELRISARIQSKEILNDQKNNSGDISQRSNFSSYFERQMTLEHDVNPAGVKTEVNDGVLTINIPRKNHD
ncbi:MAG: Hsp20/alpha crystallin family protein [Magnetococcus sp. YQC-5]